MNNFNQLQQTGNLSNEIKFRADSETIEILKNCYPELREALINLAIKKFKETTEYYNYFLNKELRDSQMIESDQNLNQNNNVLPQQNQTTNQVQSQPQTTTTTSTIDLSAGW